MLIMRNGTMKCLTVFASLRRSFRRGAGWCVITSDVRFKVWGLKFQLKPSFVQVCCMNQRRAMIMMWHLGHREKSRATSKMESHEMLTGWVGLGSSLQRTAQWTKVTHSSVVSFGRPLGRVLRALLLQRTTVSKHEHSAGHLSTGEQLLSSSPDGDSRGDRRKDKGVRHKVIQK